MDCTYIKKIQGFVFKIGFDCRNHCCSCVYTNLYGICTNCRIAGTLWIVWFCSTYFIVCFSFQHRHFEDDDDLVDWIRNIISGNTLAIEFFNNEKRGFGGEIAAEELQDLSYEKLEHFTGYYGLTKLFDVADSFKIRGWDSNYNFDYTMTCEADGSIAITQAFVGIL